MCRDPRPDGFRKQPTKGAVYETVYGTAREVEIEIAPDDHRERFLVSAVLGCVQGRDSRVAAAIWLVLHVFARAGLS
jgi:hypothetical protein